MANPRKALGTAGERGIVQRAIDAGLKAFRQPLSGQLKGFPADVVIEAKTRKILVESKVRSLVTRPGGKVTWTIDFNWLKKVMREADDGGFDHGALFVRPKGSQSDHYVLLNEDDYLNLLSR